MNLIIGLCAWWALLISKGALLTLKRIQKWIELKRVCRWCGKPHSIGGNPFAKMESTGMCRKALLELRNRYQVKG